MKILHVLPYVPVPPIFGGALRIYHILNHLSKHHDVTVASFYKPGEEEVFRSYYPALKNRLHFVDHSKQMNRRKLIFLYSLLTRHSHWYNLTFSAKMQALIDKLLAENEFDIIQSEFPVMGNYVYNSNAIKILDSHNVEYDNFRRMEKINHSTLLKYYYKRESELFFHEEIAACFRQDAIFVTSERDRTIYNKDVPQIPKFVIPNGVDVEYFQSTTNSEEPFSLVFVGMMGYVPNYDGILYFLEEIYPKIRRRIPQVKIYIVGVNPPKSVVKYRSSHIIVTGFVEDVRPYIERSSVYVVPLRMGGGTRLKILEALAMKKPVVSTSIGCEGIDLGPEKSIVVADEADSFADAVVELLYNKEKSAKLAQTGFEMVRKKYDWSIIGQQIEDAFDKLMNQPDDLKEAYGERFRIKAI